MFMNIASTSKTRRIALHSTRIIWRHWTVPAEHHIAKGDRHGRDRMVIELTTTCAISVYHH